jgi:cytochrome c
MAPYMGLFDLTAKMWSMAPVMIPAQEDELGAQIQLTGDELSDLIAFMHDDVEQSKLTIDALSEEQRAAVAEMANMDGGGDSKDEPADNMKHMAASQPTRLLMPQMNAEEGRKLFVSKGCATCHSVNGVGGDFGPALDASGEAPFVSLFDVPARMWSKAPVMIPAQEDQLG